MPLVAAGASAGSEAPAGPALRFTFAQLAAGHGFPYVVEGLNDKGRDS